jgi:4-amino-4-deoxy-L-arabinose transferase-like glycosyltransferase
MGAVRVSALPSLRRPAAFVRAVGAHAGIRPVLALAAITILAGALRLVALRSVPPDPFYDAAVRSMGDSWHNFFFGAYEPGGSVSIDKPPVDLWLQVISVKVLGFTQLALKLPEALAGTLAVPVLAGALRRTFGARAALAAAAALAVLPISVLTARSDTMDGVMMLLCVVAFWCVARAAETRRPLPLLAGAAAMGLAFDVKLFEGLIALPALGLFALLALRLPWLHRAAWGGAAVATFCVVALAWLCGTLLFPAAQRPFAIGSTNGSAWNAAFVFNGYDRVAQPPRAKDVLPPTHHSHHRTATPATTRAHQHAAKHATPHRPRRPVHVHITGPGAGRLLFGKGPLGGQLLGIELLVAVLFGIAALVAAARRQPARPAAVALLAWLATGTVLFSAMARLHPRYLDAFTPAVAAAAGIGLAWAVGRGGGRRAALVAGGLGAMVAYAFTLPYVTVRLGALTAICALAAVAATALVRRRTALVPVALALTLAAALAVPAAASLSLVRGHVSDSGHPGAMPTLRLAHLTAYLRAHAPHTRYEMAVTAATQAASIIVHDNRPVLVLTTYDGRPLAGLDELRRAVARHEVRYALLGGSCTTHVPTAAVCSPAAQWIRAHGRDVSHRAHVPRSLLWELPRSVA